VIKTQYDKKKCIVQNRRQKKCPWYVGPRNKEHSKQQIGNQFGKSQRSGKSSHSTSSSNSTSSFSGKFDFALHAPTRLKGLEHPIFGSIGQFLFTKMI